MTNVYKEFEVIRTEKELIKTVCDWCGKEIPKANQCNLEQEPKTDISFNIVHPCYEDSFGEGWSVNDLCESCGEKLKQLLISVGINVEDYDW